MAEPEQFDEEALDAIESLPPFQVLVKLYVDEVPVRTGEPVLTCGKPKQIWLHGALVATSALFLGTTVQPDELSEHVDAFAKVLVDRERARRAGG